MDKEKIKVIFRKWKEYGDIIALFPEIAVDTTGYYCQSYMHAGQHSPASPDIVTDTQPATPAEYKKLFAKLTELGYNLEVIKRFRQSHQKIRMKMY